MSSKLMLDCLSSAHRCLDQPAPLHAAACVSHALGSVSGGSSWRARAAVSPCDAAGGALGSPAGFHMSATMGQPRGRPWADYTPTTPGAALEIFGFYGTRSSGTASARVARSRLETIECDCSSDGTLETSSASTNIDGPRSALQASQPEDSSDTMSNAPNSLAESSVASTDEADAVDIGDLPSVGSAQHDGSGGCRPCAWFWTSGCINGKLCRHCHLCPEGELTRRKEEKRQRLIAATGVELPRRKGKKQRRAAARSSDAPLASQLCDVADEA